MAKPTKPGTRETLAKDPARDKLGERADLRAELDNLEARISELKVQYEQYFAGLMPFAPEKQHTEVKNQLRRLMRAPFRSSAMQFRLRGLESRFQTFNTYWQRVLKQKEEGTYSKDVFKAELHERIAVEEAQSRTAAGAARKNMEGLFHSYCQALEKTSGKTQQLDYEKFKTSLMQRAKDFKERKGAKKVSFKVSIKDGRVSVQLIAKD